MILSPRHHKNFVIYGDKDALEKQYPRPPRKNAQSRHTPSSLNSSTFALAFLESFWGILMLRRTRMSPRVRRPVGMPLPFPRNVSFIATPSGILSLIAPSSVSIAYSAPKSASESLYQVRTQIRSITLEYFVRQYMYLYIQIAGDTARHCLPPFPDKRITSPF